MPDTKSFIIKPEALCTPKIWHLSRTITSFGTMKGKAKWFLLPKTHSKKLDLYQYEEKGLATQDNGNQFIFNKIYYYLFSKNGFNIFFDAKAEQLFQKIILTKKNNTLTGKAEHLCIKDLYTSIYELNLPESLSIKHKVKGPRKNFTITTKLQHINT